MKLSPAGIDALKAYEGLRLTAYTDSGGVWTIGYGHTGDDVGPGLTWTPGQADDAFVHDTEWAQATVRTDVTVPITQPQFDALVSLAYNIGAGAFARSTLLRLLNAGDYRGAADQFLVWNRVKGQVVTGLAVRRAAERAMFLETPSSLPQPKETPSMAANPPSTADTVATVATVAGMATGNPWVGPALQVLRGLWPELKTIFVGPDSSEVAQRNAKAAEAVIGAVMAATGTDSPPDAVKAVQADPVMAQQARAAAVDVLDQFGLVEVGGGIVAARTFAAAPDAPPYYKTGAWALTLLLMPPIYWVIFIVTRDGSPYGADIRASVVTAIITGALGALLGFWVGQTFKRQQAPGQ